MQITYFLNTLPTVSELRKEMWNTITIEPCNEIVDEHNNWTEQNNCTCM